MIFGIILLAFGGFIAACNWTAPIISWRSGRNVSMVPLIGGALVGAGIYFLTGSAWWALLGIPLDLGTLTLIVSLPWLVNELWSTSRFARLHQFECRDSGREIRIELSSNSKAALTIVFDQFEAAEYFDSYPVQIGFAASLDSHRPRST